MFKISKLDIVLDKEKGFVKELSVFLLTVKNQIRHS